MPSQSCRGSKTKTCCSRRPRACPPPDRYPFVRKKQLWTRSSKAAGQHLPKVLVKEAVGDRLEIGVQNDGKECSGLGNCAPGCQDARRPFQSSGGPCTAVSVSTRILPRPGLLAVDAVSVKVSRTIRSVRTTSSPKLYGAQPVPTRSSQSIVAPSTRPTGPIAIVAPSIPDHSSQPAGPVSLTAPGRCAAETAGTAPTLWRECPALERAEHQSKTSSCPRRQSEVPARQIGWVIGKFAQAVRVACNTRVRR